MEQAKSREEVEKFLEKIKVNVYEINDDLSVNTISNVYVIDDKIEYLPITFNIAKGNFVFSNTGLKSAKGLPKIAEKTFSCRNQNFNDIEYLPNVIKGLIILDDNNFKNLEKAEFLKNSFKINIQFQNCPLNTFVKLIENTNLHELTINKKLFDRYILDDKIVDLIKKRGFFVAKADSRDFICITKSERKIKYSLVGKASSSYEDNNIRKPVGRNNHDHYLDNIVSNFTYQVGTRVFTDRYGQFSESEKELSFKEFFKKRMNEDEAINSTSDVAVHGKPLFGDENNEMVEVMCRNCNTKNSVAKNDKGKKLKCAFCGEEN